MSPSAIGSVWRQTAKICGAWTTGSGGNRIASSAFVRSPAAMASVSIVWLCPKMPPSPVSWNPLPIWIGALHGQDHQERPVVFVARDLGVQHPEPREVERAPRDTGVELQRARVLVEPGVVADVAATVDRPGFDEKPDSLGRHDRVRRLPVPGRRRVVAGGAGLHLLERVLHADPGDGGGHDAARDLHRGVDRESERERRARHAVTAGVCTAETDAKMQAPYDDTEHGATADREPDRREIDGEVDDQCDAAVEVQAAALLAELDAEPELRVQAQRRR